MINRRLNEVLSENTSAHWLAALEDKRIPCAPVNRFSQAFADEQVQHRNMIVDLKHPNGKSTKGPGNPVKFSRTSEEAFIAAPEVGQDTDHVLGELLGYDAAQIAALKAEETIGG
jgi:crotonobetainyl-CoA:carnitine CoA-transferase CaiB-like acyl-CoA transferase